MSRSLLSPVTKPRSHATPLTVRTLAGFAALNLGLAFGPAPVRGADAPDATVSGLKKMSLEELLDVEVMSVSRHPEKLLDAASAIQVVTNDDIRRSGASNLPEALRLAGNLQVAQKNPHDWGISARGFNTDLANKLLVLIDGRTVYTPLYSGVFWDVQDYLLEDIDRIEVISGPGGTLWGANAVNGVINIVSKSAKDTQGLFLTTGAGSELESLFGARYGGAISPDIHFRVYGKYSEHDDGVFDSGAEGSNGSKFGRGGFRLDATPSSANTFTLQGDLYNGDEEVDTGGNAKTSGGNVLGRWSRVFSDDADLSLQLYYDRTHLAAPKPANGFAPGGILGDDLDTYDLDFQHRFPLGTHSHVVWGLGYRFTHDEVKNIPNLSFLPPTLDQNLFSGFAQDEFMLAPDVTFTIGTKIEHNDYTGLEVEPGIRLQWNFAEQQMAWAAISRAVRTPSRIDRDLMQPTLLAPPLPESILTGGPDFDSETVVAYELGYRTQIATNFIGSASVFFNDYDHVRSLTPGPAGFPKFGFPLVFHNNLEGETYGLELSGNYQALSWWRLHGSYNLLQEYLRVKSGAVDFSNGINETADPQQQFALRSSFDLPHRVEFDADFRWVDTLHNNNGPTPGTVPSYSELDLRLGWQPTDHLELSIVGQNLLDDHHPEYGYPGATRVEVSRSYYGKMTWRF